MAVFVLRIAILNELLLQGIYLPSSTPSTQSEGASAMYQVGRTDNPGLVAAAGYLDIYLALEYRDRIQVKLGV